jgi:serine/threonine protein kinase
MKLICTLCEQMSIDGNLWCEQIDCPAGNMPIVLGYGEFLGDIKIVRLLRLFRTAAVYEAEREDTLILLKVAHEGHEEALKQESTLLARLAQSNQPNLPRLLPAYRQGKIKSHTYGKAIFRNETKYYAVFEHITGEFLRDSLLQNPQPWYQHAAWITLGIAQGLTYLYKHDGGLHLNLSPDVIMIREDNNGTPIPVLLDMGMILKPQTVDGDIIKRALHHIIPSYIAPEAMQPGAKLTEASDVYGLGLLLYEMLHGAPAYPYRLRRGEEIRLAVRNGILAPLDRRDIPQTNKVQTLISQAVSRSPDARQPTVIEFGKQFTEIFGGIPAPKRSIVNRFSEWSMPVVVGSVVFMLMVILFAAVVHI